MWRLSGTVTDAGGNIYYLAQRFSINSFYPPALQCIYLLCSIYPLAPLSSLTNCPRNKHKKSIRSEKSIRGCLKETITFFMY